VGTVRHMDHTLILVTSDDSGGEQSEMTAGLVLAGLRPGS